MGSNTDPDDGVTEYSIDLNGNTLSVALSGASFTFEEGADVTISNGTLELYSNDTYNTAALKVSNGTLTLDNVTLVGGPDPLYVETGATLNIIDSTVTSTQYYTIASNNLLASGDVASSSDIVINIENSRVSALNNTDTVAIYLPVPSTLNISKGSVIEGNRQAVIVRGADANISDSTLISYGLTTGNTDRSSTWSQGNEVPFCTLVVGNKSSTNYKYTSSAKLTNTTLVMYTDAATHGDDEIVDLVYLSAVNGYSTTLTYDSDTKGIKYAYGDSTEATGTEVTDIVGTNYYADSSSYVFISSDGGTTVTSYTSTT